MTAFATCHDTQHAVGHGVAMPPEGVAGDPAQHARCWRVSGRVQGVGFRPFVYRLARQHDLHGWVRNDGGVVTIHAQGATDPLRAFDRALQAAAPPAARVAAIESHAAELQALSSFEIRVSIVDAGREGHVPADLFACDDCLAEMRDPAARRFRYPFINCTQCGPRYTVISALPYDRANTTLRRFALCAACAAEYADPLDRRFHAQPLACAACGPALRWQGSGTAAPGNDPALALASAALRAGQIVALRGVGGYHLLCDATQPDAVARLRRRKQRPAKPLAVLVPWQGGDGLAGAEQLAHLQPVHRAALLDPARPLVLAPRRATGPVGPGIAPGLDSIALMLPYSPLLHLLLEDYGAPLVATSGNRGGEPVMTSVAQAQAGLAGIADGFLHHDREIARAADDPVLRLVGGALRPLRLGRGTAPLELALPRPIAVATLAVGAFGKNTVALAWGERAIVSPHIGDLGSPRSQAVFAQTCADLQLLYGVAAERVVHDAHPGFPNTRWARALGLPAQAVWHHAAHASALYGEAAGGGAAGEALLCFTWDGTGLGPDGTLWGGEALLGTPRAWTRVGSMRPFRLPGGERAALHPWRSALGLHWACGRQWSGTAAAGIDAAAVALLRGAHDTPLNAPATTAVGRLFDGAAAVLGACTHASYEGEAPMRVEAMAAAAGLPAGAPALPLERDAAGIWRADWEPLLPMLQDAGRATGDRAALFHARLAQTLCAQAVLVRQQSGVRRVGLCGGVFQNALLTGRIQALLARAGFVTVLPLRLPANDAAISYGQLVESAHAA